MFSDIPSFNAARRYGLTLLVAGAVLALLGFLLVRYGVTQASVAWLPNLAIPRPAGYLGAALLLLSAAFLSSGAMSFARQQLLAEKATHKERKSAKSERVPKPAAKSNLKLRAIVSSFDTWIETWMPDGTALAEWTQALIPVTFGLFAAVEMIALWRLPSNVIADPFVLRLVGVIFFVAAFPLLVLERICANLPAELLPEAPALDRLARVPLTAALGLGIVTFIRAAGFAWAAQLEEAVAILIFIVWLEVILRGAVTLFVPFAPIENRRSVADSSIAGSALRLALPNIRAINISVRRQFGIDLSRSWALAFIQKAALPIVTGIGVFAWLVTGVTALGINQRGVYQRLGVPVAVFQPGIHIHLPWPLGVVRPVEVGVIHQLPIEFLLPNGNGQTVPEEAEGLAPAEGPPPEGADRLWDDAHPFEGSYLIASEDNGQQSFQLSDVDMAVIYQVGLSDNAAISAAYRVADPDGLIQALSGQLLVRFLSQNTLLKLLGESREAFSNDFQAALQKQLDGLSTGIEVMAISVEAIHPPPAAASAYHDVQAAEIRAQTNISNSRGDAVRAQKAAARDATFEINDALAAGAEVVGKAQTASILFGGDRQAYGRNGNAFLLERWFGNLTQTLGKSDFIIIDHRLNGQDVPTLDLRNLTSLTPNESVPLPTKAPASSAEPIKPGQSVDDDDD